MEVGLTQKGARAASPFGSPQNDAAEPAQDDVRAALHALLDALDRQGYAFVTSTPASHAHVVARPDRQHARSLRDVFGWSLPFDADLLAPELFGALHDAGVLVQRDDGRFASPALGCRLWYHELDADIFGEELANEAYADVERIAAVGACVVREEGQ